MSLTNTIYNIIDEYKPKERMLGFGSRKNNIEKAEKIKKELKAIEEAVEKKEIDQFQELILVHNILQDRTFHPEHDSKGKYFDKLEKASQKLKTLDNQSIPLSDSKEKLSYVKFYDIYREHFVDTHPWDLITTLRSPNDHISGTIPEEHNDFIGLFLTKDLIDSFAVSYNYTEKRKEFAKSLIKQNELTSQFLKTRAEIRRELIELVNNPQKKVSPLFHRLRAVYGLIYPRPNLIPKGQIQNHLISPPLKRMSDWQPRSDTRQWSDMDWIQKSYPKLPSESALIGNLDPIYKPTETSFGEIEQEYNALLKRSSEYKASPTYTILAESDALVNHNFPCFKNGIVQMASQGNCQENIGRHKKELSWYCIDRTQGPASGQSTVDATLPRRIFEEDCDLMQLWLYKYDPEEKCFDYHTGYLTPKPGQEKACLELVRKHGKEILTNIQQVRIDNAGKKDDHWMTQVPSFALALGSYDPYCRASNPDLTELCQEFLILQYRALAMEAVLKSEALGQRVSLVLTPVGGGVFENPTQAIINAINSIQDIIKHGNVDVVLSIFDPATESDYTLCSMTDNCQLDQGKIYVKQKENTVEYTVLNDDGKPITGIIDEKALRQFKSLKKKEGESLDLVSEVANLINRNSVIFLRDILKVTFYRNHTVTAYQKDIPFLKNAPKMSHNEMSKVRSGVGLLENYEKHQKTLPKPSSNSASSSSSTTSSSSELVADPSLFKKPIKLQNEKESKENKIMEEEDERDWVNISRDPSLSSGASISSNSYSLMPRDVKDTQEGRKSGIKPVNDDLIAMVTKYQMEAIADRIKGKEEPLANEKIQNAGMLIFLLQLYNCETAEGNELIKAQINQFLGIDRLARTDTTNKTFRFKPMLEQLKEAVIKKIPQDTDIVSRTLS